MNKSLLTDAVHERLGVDASLFQLMVQRFIDANSRTDIYSNRISLALGKVTHPKTSSIYKIKGYLESARVVFPMDGSIVITGRYESGSVLILITYEDYNDVHRLKIDVLGTPETVETLISKIRDDFYEDSLPVVKWWYTARYGTDTKDFYLPLNKQVILPEYYPNIDDPEKFMDAYLKSSETVLLIAGPPGTGKTTLLRYLISKHKLSAHVIYDESLMQSDGPFQSFMFNSGENSPTPISNISDIDIDDEITGGDIMIIEDADTVLLPREDDGNKIMSRFLNISDGLIKLPNKKLVFTTNLTDFSKVDQALLRPGRCFGILNTRNLTFTEAVAAASAAGVKLPQDHRDYSLAEVFNDKTMKIRTVGFGVNH